jgi:hypothetical protein
MDRPASSRRRGVTLDGFELDTVDLDQLKSWAIEHYRDSGTPDHARSWVAAVERMLNHKRAKAAETVSNNTKESK